MSQEPTDRELKVVAAFASAQGLSSLSEALGNLRRLLRDTGPKVIGDITLRDLGQVSYQGVVIQGLKPDVHGLALIGEGSVTWVPWSEMDSPLDQNQSGE